MEDTLLIGDYLFVSKSTYGYSRYSFPFGLIPFEGRFLVMSEPKRGDIVVFKFPPDNSTDYIKRLIGLPGDRIQMKEGVLYINDEAVPKEKVDDYVETIGGETAQRPALSRDAAQRRELRRARPRSPGQPRQHRGLRGSRRPLLHDGRQPRQFRRQPRRRRLCSVREFRRQGTDHLLLDQWQRADLGSLEVAFRNPIRAGLAASSSDDTLASLEAILRHRFV